jgi:hypothetical protein
VGVRSVYVHTLCKRREGWAPELVADPTHDGGTVMNGAPDWW